MLKTKKYVLTLAEYSRRATFINICNTVLLLKASQNFVNHCSHSLQINTTKFDDKIILREKKKVVSKDLIFNASRKFT